VTAIAADAPVQEFTVTKYRCPHCRRRSWQSRARAEAHAARCWWNHGCKSCKHADLLAGSYVEGCLLGEDLTDPDEPDDPAQVRPRSQCPLWEAIGGRP